MPRKRFTPYNKPLAPVKPQEFRELGIVPPRLHAIVMHLTGKELVDPFLEMCAPTSLKVFGKPT